MSTRSFVDAEIGPEPEKASEAVDTETPAAAATSASVVLSVMSPA